MRLHPLVPFLALCAWSGGPVSAQSQLHFATGPHTDAQLGNSIDGAGDVNADGYADYIVGMSTFNGPAGFRTGAAEVHSGVDDSLLHVFVGDAVNQMLGYVVTGAGDVNADGHDDLLIGAPLDSAHGTRSGLARVYSGLDGALLHEFRGTAANFELGWTVAGLGDLNDDGHADFAVGEPHGGLLGKVLVHSGLDGSVLFTLVGDNLGWDYFGKQLDAAGDMDADGLTDIIVGLAGAGEARVFSGQDGRLLRTFGLPYSLSKYWPSAVAGVGDVNADGYADVAATDFGDCKLFPFAGMVRVFSGFDGSPLYTYYGMSANANFGVDVDGAGDVNADGFDDIVTGAPVDTFGPVTGTGGLVVYSGIDGSLLKAFALKSNQPGDGLGRVVAGIGDVNGDGFDDIGAGMFWSATGGYGAGAYLTCSVRFLAGEIDPVETVYNHPSKLSILGSGFEPDSPITVTVGGTPATGVTWVSPERVDCITPGDGVQNTVVDVTLEQEGQKLVLKSAMTLAGTKLLGVWPPSGPWTGGDEVVLYGENFVDDGSTVVTLGGELSPYQATILEIDEPNIMLIKTPAMPYNAGPGVKIVSSAGTAFSYFGYAFKHRWVYPHTGNITGGEVITMYGEIDVSPNNDYTARVGLVPAQVLSVVPGKAEILTPAIEESDGHLQDVWLMSPTIGSQVAQGQFLYTPYANATQSGNAFTGLKLSVSIRSSSPTPQTNLVTLFTVDTTQMPPPGIPTASTAGSSVAGSGAGASASAGAGGTSATSSAPARSWMSPVHGPTGKLHGVPMSIIAANVPVPILATALKIKLGQVSPFLIGTTVTIQGLVTGEGSPFGSWTNPIGYVIQ